VPAVALFGLVGCYDTFRASVAYFFVFLVCQATLLARAHGRAMLRQARSSGMEALEITAMRKGPWRWMAGPEWALGSALTIVLISVIGAPILRESASGFSGLVRYTPPASPLAQPSVASLSQNGTRIGQGPNQLRDIPVLRAQLPEPLYLRGFAYGRYDRGAWMPRSAMDQSDPSATNPVALASSDISDPREITFRIEPLQIYNTVVPVPGAVQALVGDSYGTYFPNIGDSYSVRAEPPYPPMEGRSLLYGGKAPIRDIDPDMGQVIPDYLQKDGIPADVALFAKNVTRGAKNDLQKALMIKRAIESTAKYNLDAAATPQGADPVQHFLFTSKEGYCDLFASSMTLMARAVGLPARYVTGYYPFNSDVDDQGRYIVRQRDAHAWCEICFKNAGWVIFDATEGAEQVSRRGSSNDRPFWQQGWFIMIAGFGGGTGVAYLGFLGVSAFKRYRFSNSFAERNAIKQRLRLKAEMRKQYSIFERELRRVVHRPRRMGETIVEYVRAAQPGLAHRSAMAMQMGSALTATLYSSPNLDPGAVEDMKRHLGEFVRARRSMAT
jgi:transglutaminase-like putative cysteine protease